MAETLPNGVTLEHVSTQFDDNRSDGILEDAIFRFEDGPGDKAEAQPKTYAILDSAKAMNLSEMIETSGETHRCLFHGKAQTELAQVAPWLVVLSRDALLSRNLLSRGDAPWEMRDRIPGVFIVAGDPFDAVYKHLRHFIRVQDTDGKWFHLRFWDPDGLIDLAVCLFAHNAATLFRAGYTFVAPTTDGFFKLEVRSTP